MRGALERTQLRHFKPPARLFHPMSSPTHLLINGETIFVTTGNQVMTAPIPNPYTAAMPSWVFTPLLAIDSGDAPAAVLVLSCVGIASPVRAQIPQ